MKREEGGKIGGPDADRTRYLHNAIVALSQMSYGPSYFSRFSLLIWESIRPSKRSLCSLGQMSYGPPKKKVFCLPNPRAFGNCLNRKKERPPPGPQMHPNGGAEASCKWR